MDGDSSTIVSLDCVCRFETPRNPSGETPDFPPPLVSGPTFRTKVVIRLVNGRTLDKGVTNLFQNTYCYISCGISVLSERVSSVTSLHTKEGGSYGTPCQFLPLTTFS